MRDENRGTGRTTQLIQRALESAIAGNTVVYVAHNYSMCQYIDNLMRDCLSANGISIQRINQFFNYAVGQNNGRLMIRQVSKLESLRGLEYQDIFVDHAVRDYVSTLRRGGQKVGRLHDDLDLAIFNCRRKP